MCFLNILQHVKFELYLRYHRILMSSLLALFTLIWITFFGESIPKWMIINLHEYYGIYEKARITKFLATWILIQEKHFKWQNWNHHSRVRQVNDPTREHHVQTSSTLVTQRRWCFIDGSWKDKEVFSGQVWYSTLPGFDALHNSDIVHVPRTENLRADSLERSGRKQTSFVVHMDVELPIWFTESI